MCDEKKNWKFVFDRLKDTYYNEQFDNIVVIRIKIIRVIPMNMREGTGVTLNVFDSKASFPTKTYKNFVFARAKWKNII